MFLRLAPCRMNPKISVPTKSTIPMMANQSRPSNTNPTIDSTAQATSKIRITVHILVTIRFIPLAVCSLAILTGNAARASGEAVLANAASISAARGSLACHGSGRAASRPGFSERDSVLVLWGRAFEMGGLARPAAVDAMFLHGLPADRTFRVRRRDIGRFVRIAELRRALELIEEASPGCPEPRLSVPGGFMPESSFSFAHKRNIIIFVCVLTR